MHLRRKTFLSSKAALPPVVCGGRDLPRFAVDLEHNLERDTALRSSWIARTGDSVNVVNLSMKPREQGTGTGDREGTGDRGQVTGTGRCGASHAEPLRVGTEGLTAVW